MLQSDFAHALVKKGGLLTLDQWLLKFDPANLSVTVLVFILLVTAILFVWTKFWPWYVTWLMPVVALLPASRLRRAGLLLALLGLSFIAAG